MKKLAILALVVVSACRRQAVVTTAPPQQTPAPSASNLTGGASPREALTKFLAAVKAQDLQALGNVWGTADAGPANGGRYVPRDEMERRMIIMIRCTRHDSWSVRSETPVEGAGRQFSVELKLKGLTGVTDFVAVQGPEARWYIREFDAEKVMRTICQAP